MDGSSIQTYVPKVRRAILASVLLVLTGAATAGCVSLGITKGASGRYFGVAALGLLAILFLFLAIRAWGVSVSWSAESLIVHNMTGRRTIRVERSQVQSLEMRPRTVGRGAKNLQPYVTQTSGEGFWIDALPGRSPDAEPPQRQVDAVREICSSLQLPSPV
jgi:hypothetical protein